MKKIKTFICISMLTWSCTSKKDYLDSLNSAPVVKFSNGISLIRDSIKMSIKHGQKSYSTIVTIADINNNIRSLGYSLKAGSGTVKIESITNPVNTDKTYKISFEPSAINYNLIDLTATDQFDAEGNGRLEVIGFTNLAPIASFSTRNLGVFDSREYEFDGTASTDMDQKFGGGIVEYKYSINGDVKINDQAKINYIFPKSGNYTVELVVIDNDGQASAPVSQIVTVN